MKTITLPNPVLKHRLVIKNPGPDVLHITAAYDLVKNDQPEIDGALTKTVKDGEQLAIYSDGKNYFTVKHKNTLRRLLDRLNEVW